MNTLVLHLAEDAYNGDAVASIAIDGGKSSLVVVTSSHAAGAVLDWPCGSYDDGAHQVSVSFINDSWGGTPALDRNLYLVGATFGGVAVPGATASLFADGTFTFTIPAGIALTLANLAAREDREDAEIAALEAKVAALSPAPIVMPPPVVTPPVVVAAPPAPPPVTVPATPIAPVVLKPIVLTVGPSDQFPRLIDAFDSVSQQLYDKAPVDISMIVDPAGSYPNQESGHYLNVGWPIFDGVLNSKFSISSKVPGKLVNLPITTPSALYYGKGILIVESFDFTASWIRWTGARRGDVDGNYSGMRLEDSSGATWSNTVTFDHNLFDNDDDGVLIGNTPGQNVVFTGCEFANDGVGDGRAHNVYVGTIASVLFDGCYSHDCTIGHLLKSRADVTTIRNTRLFGNAGTESACLDTPNGGIVDIENVIMAKSPGSDAGWIWHYAGENHDTDGGPQFRPVSSIKVRGLTMIAPPSLVRHPDWGIQGFVNMSGDPVASGKGSYLVTPDYQDVKTFGLTAAQVGFANYTPLATMPVLDLTSPVAQ